MSASDNGHLAVLQALLAKGADVSAKDDHGETALMMAEPSGKRKRHRIIGES
jgi:ankyrin repeat protein